VPDTANGVSLRGTSSNGDVVVGTSTNGTFALWAYRYKEGEGVTAIPRLPGGTFNRSIAVSPDGDLVLLSGNNLSPGNISEVYFWRASTNQIQQLGSPNTASTWNPGFHPL
jgi:WD40 repeat protein